MNLVLLPLLPTAALAAPRNLVETLVALVFGINFQPRKSRKIRLLQKMQQQYPAPQHALFSALHWVNVGAAVKAVVLSVYVPRDLEH